MTIIQLATNQRHISFNPNLTNHKRMIWTSDTEYGLTSVLMLNTYFTYMTEKSQFYYICMLSTMENHFSQTAIPTEVAQQSIL
jgi:hypothetical protein